MSFSGSNVLIIRLAAHYAAITLPMFAIWELAQLPLYTIWKEQGLAANLWAVLHCTAGDEIIAFVSLLVGFWLSDAVFGHRSTSGQAVSTIAVGVLVTGAAEIISTQWLGRWAYSALMPVEPLSGIGLSPLAQWIIVPAAALRILWPRLQLRYATLANSQGTP